MRVLVSSSGALLLQLGLISVAFAQVGQGATSLVWRTYVISGIRNAHRVSGRDLRPCRGARERCRRAV